MGRFSNHMPKRKYRTEFALNAYASWGALFTQNEFDHLIIPEGKEPQIYFIAKRPRLFCKPNQEISIEGNIISGIAIAQRADGDVEVPFRIALGEKGHEITCKCEAPYNLLKLTSNGKPFSASLSTLLTCQKDFPKEYLDLEILYIGQSNSQSGSYDIRKRLENHSTLQKIYAEANQKFYNCEIFLGVFHFETQVLAMIDGTSEIEVSEEEDDEHTRAVMERGFSEEEMINFAEAGLITYFEPEFNKVFKGTFPNEKHKSYASCYELDINKVAITLSCDTINTEVFTEKVPKNLMHLAEFSLHSKEERREFLDIDALN